MNKYKHLSLEVDNHSTVRVGADILDYSLPITAIINGLNLSSGVRFQMLFNGWLGLRAPMVNEFVGFDGITGRSARELEMDLPSVEKELGSVSGKTVFLANRLSDVPLVLTDRYEQGQLTEPPVVVDIFDYVLLGQDLKDIVDALEQRGIPVLGGILERYNTLLRILKATENGSLRTVKYCVGSGAVPKEITHASLVISCHGPSERSLPEELSLLQKGGVLLTTIKLVDEPEGFSKTPLFPDGYPSDVRGHRYQRLT